MTAAPQTTQTTQEDAESNSKNNNNDNNNDVNKSGTGRWLALESNPSGANKFARRMGLPQPFCFADIYGLDAELLAFVPQTVVAVMLLFPSSPAIKEYKQKQATELSTNPQSIADDLFYLYQHDSIGNACGTIAMIHAIASLTHKKSLKPITLDDGVLKKFMHECAELDWTERGWHLLKCQEIQEASESVATDNDNQTATPDRDERVSAHFICFVCIDSTVYELDGRKKCPINHCSTSKSTFLADVANIVKTKFMNIDPTNLNFNLLALTSND